MKTPRPASPASAIVHMLPRAQPSQPSARLLLLAIRRLAANGLHDAATAHLFLTTFGPGFRRPLTLLRTLMAEISATSSRSIRIAPPCCCRMTADEAALIDCLARVVSRPDSAAVLASDLTDRFEPAGILIAASALATAFEDLGAPIGD